MALLAGAALEIPPSVASTTHLVGGLLVSLRTGLGLLAACAYTRTFAVSARPADRGGGRRPPAIDPPHRTIAGSALG